MGFCDKHGSYQDRTVPGCPQCNQGYILVEAPQVIEAPPVSAKIELVAPTCNLCHGDMVPMRYGKYTVGWHCTQCAPHAGLFKGNSNG